MPGKLYLTATPIGNLEDITQRALRILGEADIIAAEDTRRTLALLTHFGIRGNLVRYDENNKAEAGPRLVEELLSGKDVALVTDAGFPGISDPGEDMAKLCVENGIDVVPVPGPSACLTALCASALPASSFFFEGFLPRSKNKRKERLELLRDIPGTLILYEAPHRIKEVLKDVYKVFGDRRICLARELTKVHEEFWRGSLLEATDLMEQKEPRGEYVIVIDQGEGPPEEEPKEAPLATVLRLLKEGAPKKEALSEAAKMHNMPRRVLYNELVKFEEEQDPK